MPVILDVNNLNVCFKSIHGIVPAVNNISFQVTAGEILGIVGESGSGKSQSVMAIMGLLHKNAIISGSAKFLGHELIGANNVILNKLRGNQIAMIFQDPISAFNPYLTIQKQMIEVLITHCNMSKRSAIDEVLRVLDLVKLPDAKNRLKMYPHEFSGGMLQRVMIAMALLCKPKLIIADEPTTALDVTIQAQILQLLRDIQTNLGTAMIIITHDMGVVANICDRVNVIYGGQIMESGNVDDVFTTPLHPYTQLLLKAIPSFDECTATLANITGE
jgi:oligopeptide transport system ATP-binding protein